MGWQTQWRGIGYYHDISNWSPSTRIDHAWEVVQAMMDKHGMLFTLEAGYGNAFMASFNNHDDPSCRAALQAVNVTSNGLRHRHPRITV